MSAARPDFALAPLSRAAAWFFPALWLVLVAVSLLRPPATAAGAPMTDPVPPWLIAVFGCALVAVGPWILLQYRNIHILDGNLVVQAASFFPRRFAIDTLDLGAARIVDTAEHTDYWPMLWLWGFGLPAFRAGHYLLRNRAHAYCLLTRREKVLVLPRRGGGFVLLSPEEPRALLDALRTAMATTRARV